MSVPTAPLICGQCFEDLEAVLGEWPTDVVIGYYCPKCWPHGGEPERRTPC